MDNPFDAAEREMKATPGLTPPPAPLVTAASTTLAVAAIFVGGLTVTALAIGVLPYQAIRKALLR